MQGDGLLARPNTRALLLRDVLCDLIADAVDFLLLLLLLFSLRLLLLPLPLSSFNASANINQERIVQGTRPIPIFKHSADLLMAQTEPRREQHPDFGHDAHHALLDAIMHHLDVVAATTGADGDDARPAPLVSSGHLLQEGEDERESLGAAPRRHRGPVSRALVPARYAAPHVVHAARVEVPLSPLRVRPVLVAAVDDHVARAQVRLQPLDARVGWGAVGRAEEDYLGLLVVMG